MVTSFVTFSYSYNLDLLLSQKKFDWKILVGVFSLFVVLGVLAFQNFKLPFIEFTEYNLIYIFVLYFFNMMSTFFLNINLHDRTLAWHYNLNSLRAYLFSIIYSAVIVLGIVGIAYLIENSFSFKWSDTVYSSLAWFSGSLSLMVFFLVANRNIRFEKEPSYPPFLKLFASYVLFPLYIIYTGFNFVILYQVLTDGFIADAWMGYVFFFYIALGYTIYFIIYPLFKTEKQYFWVKNYEFWYFAFQLPISALTVYFTWHRILINGVIEARYLLLIGGIMVFILSLFRLISGYITLRILTNSILIILVILLWGPLNINTYSNNSQTQQAIEILNNYGLIENNQYQDSIANKVHLVHEDRQKLASVLTYLSDKNYHKPLMSIIDTSFHLSADQYFNLLKEPHLSALLSNEDESKLDEWLLVELAPNLKLTNIISIDSFRSMYPIGSDNLILLSLFSPPTSDTLMQFAQFKFGELQGYRLDMTRFINFIVEQRNSNSIFGNEKNTIFQMEKQGMNEWKTFITNNSDSIPAKIVILEMQLHHIKNEYLLQELKGYIYFTQN